jgi:hypothetical protein
MFGTHLPAVLLVLASISEAPPKDNLAAGLPLFPVMQNGKYGFMNRSGQVAVSPRYDDVGDFAEGLAWVKRDGKCGYVDPNGREVIPPQYYTYTNAWFSEGMAAICVGNYGGGKWGFIDRSGAIAIEPQFELAGFFSEGLAFVVKDGKRGFIDKNGDFAIKPRFEMAQWFSEGLAPARAPGGRWGYIDRVGTFVIAPQYDMAQPFSEGLACVDKLVREKTFTEKRYCIDRTGKTVIDHPGGTFFDGLAAINAGGYVEGQWGYKNKMGDYVIKPQFVDARRFSEGLAAVKIHEQWGFIDKKGNLVIQPAFSHCGLFENGLAPVSVEGTHEYFLPFGAKGHADAAARLGYVDATGRYVWSPSR